MLSNTRILVHIKLNGVFLNLLMFVDEKGLWLSRMLNLTGNLLIVPNIRCIIM